MDPLGARSRLLHEANARCYALSFAIRAGEREIFESDVPLLGEALGCRLQALHAEDARTGCPLYLNRCRRAAFLVHRRQIVVQPNRPRFGEANTSHAKEESETPPARD